MSSDAPSLSATQLLAQIPALRRRAATLCRGRADVDDLVQQTLLRALEHRDQFAPGTNLRAWLLQILYHTFVSTYRRSKRERLAFERLAFEPSTCEIAPGVECVSELPERIKRALGVLPNAMADVVRLVDLDELSYREAAQSLNVPVGTVMSRLYRGRERLAAELAEGMGVAA
jgi:RNA polymerase sigma-70 factor (ECF subfamily)